MSFDGFPLKRRTEKMPGHVTLRVGYDTLELVRSFRRLAREANVDASEYLRRVLEQAASEGLEKLKRLARAA